jgi:hypothetical protein
MSDTASEPRSAVDDGAPNAANPMLSALLGSLAGGGGVDPMSLMLSQLGGQPNDPKMALLAKLLEQRRTPEAEADADAEPEPETVQVRENLVRDEVERRTRELRALAKKMYRELTVLRERNDTLAAALGACHLCFGSDPMCEECSGRGVPGSLVPEPAAYRDYVLPAVQRVRAIHDKRERRLRRYLDPGPAVADSGASARPTVAAANQERGQTA